MQKILIVEDDGDIAAIERDYLELNNYQVEIAADGLAGLERGLHGDFDLILLDLMLPGMDGFSVCRRLREETDIPILMVTARREDIDKIRGLGLGADDYIEKPFSPSVLVARVRAHLARYQRLTGGQQRAKPELQVGGVRLNTETRRVFVDGRDAKFLKSFSTHFFQCLLNYTRSADSYIDNCICLCHSKECTRHKRIIIRCIAENHQLCTSKGIIVLCRFCRFFYDLTTESYRIHIDPGFRRPDIYGTTDPFRLSQCLRNGTDQILFTLRHPF